MNSVSIKTYQYISAWRRIPGKGVVRYNCFKILPDETYCVQSADFFEAPIDAKQIKDFENQKIELLADCAPEERVRPMPSLEQAINLHDQDFGNYE